MIGKRLELCNTHSCKEVAPNLLSESMSNNGYKNGNVKAKISAKGTFFTVQKTKPGISHLLET